MDRMEENLKLYEAMENEKNLKLYKRYTAVYLFLCGESITKIAAKIDMSTATVSSYIQAYREHGLEGLVPKKQSGRPVQLSTEQEKELKELVLGKCPRDLGIAEKNYWTADLVKELIKSKYGIEYSIRGTINILNRLGIHYTRGTYFASKEE